MIFGISILRILNEKKVGWQGKYGINSAITMTLRRKILLGLLILPAATIIAAMAFPGAGAELAFLIVGVPILVLNAWEFFLGESAGSIFEIPSQRPLRTGQEGSTMKSKSIAALIILSSVFLLLIIGYTVARSVVDEVPYFTALYAFMIKLGTKVWHFLTTPLIFISLLLFVLVLIIGTQILPMLRKARSTEAANFPDSFLKPVQPAFADAVAQANDIGQGMDPKAIQLMLEIDGLDMTKPYLLSKLEALGINSEGVPADVTKVQREAFYRGMLEGLYGYLFPLFNSIEIKNNDSVARFSLKPGVRERLMERLNKGGAAAEEVAAQS